MIARIKKGQNLVEFLIILALVAVVSIAGLSLLGGNIKSMLFASNQSVENFQPFGVPADRDPTAGNETPTPPENLVTSTDTINGIEVSNHEDGSSSFTYNGEEVKLSSDLINLNDIVFETAGANGKEILVKELAYLIDKYRGDYPEGEMPIDIHYGLGERAWTGDPTSAYYQGNAVANSLTIQVGDHVVITQHDQDSYASWISVAGVYRIEGDISAGKLVNGHVTGENYHNGWTYTGDISTSQNNNLDLNSADNSLYLQNFKYTDEYGATTSKPTWTYNWDFDFSNDEGFKFKV